MAITQNTYTGDGTTVLFTIAFPYLERDHVKASLNGTPTTAFTFANSNTIQFNVAPANGVTILLFRETESGALQNQFFPNSSIPSSSLNNNFTQNLYVVQEIDNVAAAANATAASAVSTAQGAVVTANTAEANSLTAINTANIADANAAAAVITANAADVNASAAVVTANAASVTAAGAVSTANSAAAAVAAAVFYQPVIDLAALALLTPADGEFFELQDSTGAETDPSITNVPMGLVGAAGLTFRLRYNDPPGEYEFLGYFANDSETRYLKTDAIGVTVEPYDASILKSADIGVTVQGYDAGTLKSSDIGVTVQGYDAGTLKSSDIGVTVQGYDANTLKSGDIGTTVQGYDADTVKTDVLPTFTVATRTTERTITSGAFDLATGNLWTVGAITVPNPTNAVAGQTGAIRITAGPVVWSGNFKFPGGAAPTIATFPAIIPYYVEGSSTILMGFVTEGVAC
jgi:hypothetical protein